MSPEEIAKQVAERVPDRATWTTTAELERRVSELETMILVLIQRVNRLETGK